MDLDKGLVAAILAGGKMAYEKALSRGITERRLEGEGALAFHFLHNYVQKYEGSWPSDDMIFGWTQVLLEPPDNSLDFFIDSVHKRNLQNRIVFGLRETNAFLEKIEPERAFAHLLKLVSDLTAERADTLAVESLFKIGPEVLQYYEDIKAGKRGIQTPWDGVNDCTFGFWPEDLCIFVARLGIGKTWSAVLIAHHAWAVQNKRVLFITTEVSRMRIYMRFVAVQERLPYTELTHGRLAMGKGASEERFRKAVVDLQNREGFYIVGGDFDFQLDSVLSAIEMAKPDLLVIDGVYLLRVQGATRTERMANIFDEMKRIAKRKKVPTVITTQLNREAKKDAEKGKLKQLSADNIAMSDVGGWNADLIFGLTQSPEQHEDHMMNMQALKVREGRGRNFICNWNFERMDFTQTDGPPVKGPKGDADDSHLPVVSDAAEPDPAGPDDEPMPF